MPFKLTPEPGVLTPHAASSAAASPLPVAVIDIGSNSVRLVIYDGAIRAPTQIFNEKEQCGLGAAIASTGRLGDDAIARTLTALGRFRAVMRLLQVAYVRVVATAAVRDADDGAEFIARASDILDAELEVLSGKREAELAARGILMGFMEPDGVAGDLGGGSLELISIRKEELSKAVSVPLGVLRLDDMSGGDLREASTIIKRELDGVSWLAKAKPKRFFAVGGSWRALAKLRLSETGYPLRVMHHYTVPAAEMLAFVNRIRREKRVTELDHIEAVGRSRRDQLALGALVMARTIEIVKPAEVVLSAFGIREGLVHEMLSAQERAKDPLISFCETYADLRSRNGRLGAYELFHWMTPVIEAAGLESAAERRLRLAACLLSDIGWRAHPDYRGEQSLNVVAHSGMTGIDHAGRLFLALTVYFRHRGTADIADDMVETLRMMEGDPALARAELIAASMRTAHVLACGAACVLPELPLQADAKTLRLRLPAAYATLDGSRARRRMATLAALIEREADLVIEA
ncbi:MAG: Ppx/GppA phosphatase family protein [Pseudomonadota bacterium]